MVGLLSQGRVWAACPEAVLAFRVKPSLSLQTSRLPLSGGLPSRKSACVQGCWSGVLFLQTLRHVRARKDKHIHLDKIWTRAYLDIEKSVECLYIHVWSMFVYTYDVHALRAYKFMYAQHPHVCVYAEECLCACLQVCPCCGRRFRTTSLRTYFFLEW